MTEEKFNELKTLKEEINKLEFKLSTINNLLESVNLNMEIKGTSTCHFKINRFINIANIVAYIFTFIFILLLFI